MSTGHYRAFRIPNTEVKTSRADDTWGIAPGKAGRCHLIRICSKFVGADEFGEYRFVWGFIAGTA
ncbi:hypothetical protein [Desulfosporosinus orientis]|uniref:hypothetical protein n=1 Tax=Desulfosporosinus orientis TaxID=1563 RepID=UPI0013054673|nr:hypothetical protein [Desulfosporosinus orientis]